ncbi:uncharacterized protein LOC127851022 isoform X2 [Dreissena polymorpha]|nr:uncharacterized protein LOC127851022 isoform X2 [Dreissena polymorpha]
MASNKEKVDISKMDLDEAFDWLEAKGITHELQSLEEMRTLIYMNQRKSESSAESELSQSALSESDLNTVLSRDKEIRDRICSLYEKILQKINSTDLNEYLSAWCGCCIKKQLNKYKDELQRMDCPIVIAGETSAGKSCFLNLLLGEDILPVSLLCATATICVVHPISPEETPYFVVDGQKHEGSKEELKGKLKIKLTSRSETERIEQVDIYWQVPLIGQNKHIVFVDTPGVGESKHMTDTVFKYLPNAAAFIYVINSANAGGVQEDKLVHIFRKVLEYDKSSDLFSFDPACTLFVCNKWDIVADRVSNDRCNEQNVWEDIGSKLRKYLSADTLHISSYKMSTTEALRYIKSGMGDSRFYAELKHGLERLVIKSQTSKARMHTRWIENMINQINAYISARVKHAKASTEEKAQLRDLIDTKLDNIERNKDKVRTSLLMKCQKLSDDMGREIGLHLRKEDVSTRIKACVQQLVHEIRAPDDDAFQYNAKQRIMNIVVKEIDAWEKDCQFWRKTMEYFMHTIEKKFDILDEQCLEAESAFDNTERSMKESEFPETRRMPSFGALIKEKWENTVYPWLSKWEFKLGEFEVSIRSVVSGIHHMAKVLNREKYMRKLLKEVLKECFNEESIRRHITTTYFAPLENYIQEQCNQRIATRINACKRLLDSVASDNRNADDIIHEWHNIDENVRPIFAELGKVQELAKFE